MTEDSKIRFKFKKNGELKYLSHLETVRLMSMAVWRAGINVRYSEGFSPNPRINFSFPVPVGLASIAEYSDIEIYGEMHAPDFIKALNLQLKEQMQVLDAKNISGKIPSLMSDIALCRYIFKINAKSQGIDDDLKKNIMENEELAKSIYSLEAAKSHDPGDIVYLSLIGYTKILEDNKIFKFNDFLKYFKYLSGNLNIVVEDYFKNESYVLREGMLKTPLEVT
jgi:radical SAM-linked protein